MKTTVNFLDKNRNKVSLEIEITHRNNYPELTFSGDCNGSFGQCYSSIDPATDTQKELMGIWDKYHLKHVNEEEMEQRILDLLVTIEEEEEERKGKPLTDLEDSELIELIEQETSFSGRDAELCAAFVKMFDLCENDLQDVEINEVNCTVQGVDYTAGTDGEMDEVWDNELENYIEECILPDVPENVRRYFDNEAWKKDARYDGRGHSLNRYDGGEEEVKINDTYYYAYRQ